MQFIRVSAITLCLFLSAYAQEKHEGQQHDQRENRQHDQRPQENQREHQQQRPQEQQRPPQMQQRPQESRPQPQIQQRQPQIQQPQQQQPQQRPQLQQQPQPQQPRSPEYRPQAQQNQPRGGLEQQRGWQQQRRWQGQDGWQGHNTWQQNRARQWESEHRTWTQRGGYGGYHIPSYRFNLYFGQRHWFRINRPIIYNGYPRFICNGFTFLLVDPWPEYWSEDWYTTDDVYIDYFDGYYLINRNHPGVRLAIVVIR